MDTVAAGFDGDIDAWMAVEKAAVRGTLMGFFRPQKLFYCGLSLFQRSRIRRGDLCPEIATDVSYAYPGQWISW
jgi:hypothetical protein